MPLLAKKRVLLAKIESVYGTDPTPTGAANAILVRNLNVVPLEMDLATRENIRPFLGNQEDIVGAIYATTDFEVEMAGSGTPGVAPAIGPLFRACGKSETILAAAVTGSATAGSVSSITLAAGASAVNDAYVGMTLRTTSGTGSGQSAVIKSYNGTTKVATFTENLATAVAATTGYSIDAQVVYQPVSNNFESATIYVNVDGVLHKMLGARGTVQETMSAKGIPVFKFNFTGMYVPVADGVLPTPVFTAFQTPLAVNKANTSGLSLLGYKQAILSDLSVDLGNTVTYRNLVNHESVAITDRQTKGSITVEATTVATMDWWTAAASITTGVLSILHGTTPGNRVKIDAPRVQITKPRYSEKDGIVMLQADLKFNPAAGNDEVSITFM
jgi:hypothetical protein